MSLNSLWWGILWILIRWILKVTKEMVNKAIESVEKARDLKHEDGSPYTGKEKSDWVLEQLIQEFGKENFKTYWKSTYNTLIELAWTYVKKEVLKIEE